MSEYKQEFYAGHTPRPYFDKCILNDVTFELEDLNGKTLEMHVYKENDLYSMFGIDKDGNIYFLPTKG